MLCNVLAIILSLFLIDVRIKAHGMHWCIDIIEDKTYALKQMAIRLSLTRKHICMGNKYK